MRLQRAMFYIYQPLDSARNRLSYSWVWTRSEQLGKGVAMLEGYLYNQKAILLIASPVAGCESLYHKSMIQEACLAFPYQCNRVPYKYCTNKCFSYPPHRKTYAESRSLLSLWSKLFFGPITLVRVVTDVAVLILSRIIDGASLLETRIVAFPFDFCIWRKGKNTFHCLPILM
jgi:hypothetical protein